LAWALLLLTLVPLRLLAAWWQGRIALSAGRLLRQRLLQGALRLEPSRSDLSRRLSDLSADVPATLNIHPDEPRVGDVVTLLGDFSIGVRPTGVAFQILRGHAEVAAVSPEPLAKRDDELRQHSVVAHHRFESSGAHRIVLRSDERILATAEVKVAASTPSRIARSRKRKGSKRPAPSLRPATNDVEGATRKDSDEDAGLGSWSLPLPTGPGQWM